MRVDDFLAWHLKDAQPATDPEFSPPLPAAQPAQSKPAKRSVHFRDFVVVGYTYTQDSYDRSSIKVEKLSQADIIEVLAMRKQFQVQSLYMHQCDLKSKTRIQPLDLASQSHTLSRNNQRHIQPQQQQQQQQLQHQNQCQHSQYIHLRTPSQYRFPSHLNAYLALA